MPCERLPTESMAAPAAAPESTATIGVGKVQLGALRRLQPISNVFGFDRGKCIDRYYIEQFLSEHGSDIRGRVLEVADNQYTRRFGADRVTHSDVLHFVEGNHKSTMVADLTKAEQFNPDTFDCVILTQTLQHIFDITSAVSTLRSILIPGGVVLASVPGISQISRYDMDRWGDFWRFTTLSARRLFETAFPAQSVDVRAYGSVITAAAFLYGLVVEDLREEELAHHDRDYELLITVRAQKPGG